MSHSRYETGVAEASPIMVSVGGFRVPAWVGRAKTGAARLPGPVQACLHYGWMVADGDRPRFASEALRKLMSCRPTTFRQKMMYKLSRDRRPLIAMFANKVAVRDFVSDTVGPHWLKETYAVATRAADLPWDDLPREVVLKVSHGSGGVIVVTELADPVVRLPSPHERRGWSKHLVHPDSVTRSEAEGLLDHWLSLRYGFGPGQSREWAYTTIAPRVVAEELVGSSTELAREIWFHCFDGVPRCCLFVKRNSEFDELACERLFDWEFDQAPEASGLSVEEWDDLVAATVALARTTDSVRVDWLVGSTGARFGELTNYPGAGRLAFNGHASLSAQEVHDLMSSYWNVPLRYE